MKEHQHIEWKEFWRDEYLRWICGFANAQGGKQRLVAALGKENFGQNFGVTFGENFGDRVGDKVGDSTPSAKTTQKTTQKILELLRMNPSASRREIADVLGDITENGVKYHLEKLKSEGRLKRIGGDKGGYWQVTGENDE